MFVTLCMFHISVQNIKQTLLKYTKPHQTVSGTDLVTKLKSGVCMEVVNADPLACYCYKGLTNSPWSALGLRNPRSLDWLTLPSQNSPVAESSQSAGNIRREQSQRRIEKSEGELLRKSSKALQKKTV